MVGAVLTRMSLKRAFAAMRRKDLDAFMKAWGDDAVWVFPGETPMSGQHVGKAEVRAYWDRVFTRMERFDIRPLHIGLTRPYTFGANNVALVEWELDAKTYDGVRAHLEGVAALRIRRGRVAHGRDFIFDPTLLEAVWGRRADARTPEQRDSPPVQSPVQ